MTRNKITLGVAIGSMVALGCASQGLPQQKLTNTEASIQAAEQLGGKQHPQAALHLRFADDQIKVAERLMEDGDEEEAERMLDRAEVDAEMALALARSAGVRKEAERAWQEIQELRQSMQAAQRADRR